VIKKIPPYLRNKYSLTLIVFVFWLMFFDENNWLMQFQNKLELWELDDEKEYYLVEIEQTKSDLKELTSDMNNLERFAREKYLMKRDNEEVFVFVTE
jgi:hypothetical protein